MTGPIHWLRPSRRGSAPRNNAQSRGVGVRRMRPFIILSVAGLLMFLSCISPEAGGNRGDGTMWSERIAQSFLTMHPDSIVYKDEAKSRRWNYEQGLMLEAMFQMWKHTGRSEYLRYAQRNLDYYIDGNGAIRTYALDDFNLDNIAPGRFTIRLFQMTGEEKYRKAAALLRQQLRLQPRTASGGFWHKKIYPFQMWLDGLYMAHPFSTLYAAEFGDTAAYEDIARQIHLTERNLRDSVTGLYYHGWDESKSQRWANPKTGRSPNFWGRSIGWFAMALTDVLEIFPGDHPRRTDLERIFKDLARSILAHREQATGLWYQVMDKPGKTGNYRETSASAMFTYALAKGARLGYLNPDAGRTAEESFRGIIRHLVRIGDDGIVHLPDVCKVSGLGGSPYRDGSYEYYVGEARRTDDFKGYGPFLLAAIEIERLTAGPAADRDRGSGERSLK